MISLIIVSRRTMREERMIAADEAPEAIVNRVVERELSVTAQHIEPLAGGLGLRRFYRVMTTGNPRSVIARIEAPEDPAGRPRGSAPEPPLEPLRSFMAQHGLPVPARLGGDAKHGIELLEDLGSRTLASAVAGASTKRRMTLYRAAISLIPRLQRLSDPTGELPAFKRRLDAALFDYKAELFVRWSVPSALGREARSSEADAVRQAFRHIAREAAAAPARLAHRDFHSQNLHLCSASGGEPRLVMIDFQGAFLAPPEYDLVCLLRDSYVELPDDELARHLERVRTELPDRPDSESYFRRFDLLTLSRKGKDHARFVHAASSRGDHRFARHLSATVRALRSAAARLGQTDASLAGIADIIARLPESACEE